ncbi:MAG TPA: hypothetical protein VHG51_16140 [Longimicrobiaceae bacterium]|nr:hypothetical protein [Longimicrobiaceae bacterium]
MGAGAAGRWAKLLGGLFLYALAVALMVEGGLGLGPWDAFHLGLARAAGASVGAANVAVGVAVVAGTWRLGVRPGPGTLANMVLIGVFIDLLLPVLPPADGRTAWLYHAAGIVLTGLATGLYIAPGLGKGPRDGLMLGVSAATGIPAGRVRTGIEAAVLALGWAMGGTIGVGTVLFALAIGPVTQWGLRAFGVPDGGRPHPARRSAARRHSPQPAHPPAPHPPWDS